MVRTIQHLSDFVSMANFRLARRDTYLAHLRSGIKPDTLAALRFAPLDLATLFRAVPYKRVKMTAQYENKGYSGSSSHKKGRCNSYERPGQPAWITISPCGHSKKGQGNTSSYSSLPAKGQSPNKSQLLCSSSLCKTTYHEQKDFRTFSDFKCKLICCRSCTFCCGASTRERMKSCCKLNKVCKSVEFCPACHKCPSCCSESAQNPQFWETWAALGASAKVIKILGEGYTLPF